MSELSSEKRERLESFAKTLDAVGGNVTKAAVEFDTSRASARRMVAQIQKHNILCNSFPETAGVFSTRRGGDVRLSEEQQAKADDFGIPDGQLHSGWVKDEGASYYFQVPKATNDPKAIWSAIREELEPLPRATANLDITMPLDDELNTIIPIADLHMGLLTDTEEVGVEWNAEIATKMFREAFETLIGVTAPSRTCLIAQLGDLTHTDDQRNVTPQSGHQLDADSRFFRILRASVAAMKFAIDTALEKFGKVIFRSSRGNHDMHAHYAVTMALVEHYEGNPRVVIEDSACEFFVHEFGTNMTVLCHGDKAKGAQLAMSVAGNFPEEWGRTRRRRVLTGHVHHESAKEFNGVTVESVATIIPRDAHAFNEGYGPNWRGLMSIVDHVNMGEISRNKVSVA